MRIGLGYDIHRFFPEVGENSIMLCGVKIPNINSIDAHSDGDVALHAVVDAMLGAMAAGDIGIYFPPSDPQWSGCESRVFVEKAISIIEESNYVVSNLDMTIICKSPNFNKCCKEMRSSLADMLKVFIDDVSIKGKSGNKVGDLGDGKAIAAYVVVLLKKCV